MAVSLSNLEKNDSLYVCASVCAEEAYLHRDEGKSRVCACAFVCAVRTLVRTRVTSSHFSPVELGGRKTHLHTVISTHLEEQWVIKRKDILKWCSTSYQVRMALKYKGSA